MPLGSVLVECAVCARHLLHTRRRGNDALTDRDRAAHPEPHASVPFPTGMPKLFFRLGLWAARDSAHDWRYSASAARQSPIGVTPAASRVRATARCRRAAGQGGGRRRSSSAAPAPGRGRAPRRRPGEAAPRRLARGGAVVGAGGRIGRDHPHDQVGEVPVDVGWPSWSSTTLRVSRSPASRSIVETKLGPPCP